MDRFRQKPKKDKRLKHVDKEKSNTIVTDIKTIRENIKIKEILRTVKMNSSMRIKAPRGSKVMQNKDFTDDLNDNSGSHVDGTELEISNDSVVNIDNVSEISTIQVDKKTNNEFQSNQEISDDAEDQNDKTESQQISETEAEAQLQTQIPEIYCDSFESTTNDNQENECSNLKLGGHIVEETHSDKEDVVKRVLTRNDSTLLRNRKLSLDQTILSRREGLSQSDFDLHTMGKSPLERKSSFFRKKMDNFLKNTTEIFRRHSSHYKAQPGVQRSGSVSVSLQSLHEDSVIDAVLINRQDLPDSMSSLQSTSSLCLSGSNQSVVDQDTNELRGMASSQPVLCGSQPTIGSREHINSLSPEYTQESLLNYRAISMSSGLVSSLGRRRNSRSKRVTWLASEGLKNYLRRREQDEKKTNIQGTNSYQDLSSMKEKDQHLNMIDTKGRRLSYQRAVSGEDPVRPNKYNLLRKKVPSESQHSDIMEFLDKYSLGGFKHIRGYTPVDISPEAKMFLDWAQVPDVVEIFFEWKLRGAIGPPPPTFVQGLDTKDFFHKPYKTPLIKNEEDRQAVIRELFVTEAYYLCHLSAVVEVFIGSAHLLQEHGHLLQVDTQKLFVNLPELYNASLLFWEQTLVPMLIEGVENNTPFNSDYMALGFSRFRELLSPYERYVGAQTKALDYLRVMIAQSEFMIYLSWCQKQKSCKRLKLADILVTPLQRLTKYSLILRRIISLTDFEPERTSLIAMESFTSNFVLDMNRQIRQQQELFVLNRLDFTVETYDIDFKDDDLDRAFKMFAQINLRAPMINCLPNHSRSLIHEGDYKFKDNHKELEAHVLILTDMLLICKRYVNGHLFWKLIRPKMMVDKLHVYPKYNSKNSNELQSLVAVYLDEVGSSVSGFILTELKEKEPNPMNSLKLWEQKFKEAKYCYNLGVWYAANPSRDLSETSDYGASDYGGACACCGRRLNSEEMSIEKEARERVAAMMYRSGSTENDCSQGSMALDSFDADGSRASGHRAAYAQRNSTGSSRNSRLSSFQKSISASHEEAQPGPSTSRGSAGRSPDEGMTSITVNVASDSDSDSYYEIPVPPSVRSVTETVRNTQRIQPASGIMALVHSVANVSVYSHGHVCHVHGRSQSHFQGYTQSQTQSRSQSQGHRHDHHHLAQTSATDKLIVTHNVEAERTRLMKQTQQQQQQFLRPDNRGKSYPPPTSNRGSLTRSLAFSLSTKNPPLAKMGHVNSQSTPVTIHHEPPRANSKAGQGNIQLAQVSVHPDPPPRGSSRVGHNQTSQVAAHHEPPRASSRAGNNRQSHREIYHEPPPMVGHNQSSQVAAHHEPPRASSRAGNNRQSHREIYHEPPPMPEVSRPRVPPTVRPRPSRQLYNSQIRRSSIERRNREESLERYWQQHGK